MRNYAKGFIIGVMILGFIVLFALIVRDFVS
jgi:hypothetical protein